MPISDQSRTSSSSLAIIAALMSVSVKAPARSRVLQHSKASMVLGLSEALSSEMVCLAPENTRSGSERHARDEMDIVSHPGQQRNSFSLLIPPRKNIPRVINSRF